MYVIDRIFGQLWVRIQNLSKLSYLARRWELVDQDPRSIDPSINECSRRSTDLVANFIATFSLLKSTNRRLTPIFVGSTIPRDSWRNDRECNRSLILEAPYRFLGKTFGSCSGITGNRQIISDPCPRSRRRSWIIRIRIRNSFVWKMQWFFIFAYMVRFEKTENLAGPFILYMYMWCVAHFERVG